VEVICGENKSCFRLSLELLGKSARPRSESLGISKSIDYALSSPCRLAARGLAETTKSNRKLGSSDGTRSRFPFYGICTLLFTRVARMVNCNVNDSLAKSNNFLIGRANLLYRAQAPGTRPSADCSTNNRRSRLFQRRIEPECQ
jgi:hypothetical protein